PAAHPMFRASRQGELCGTQADDWPFNPPVVDLFDPELVEMEISRDEFEKAWLHARREPSR
ncbi:hypothetical protein, partial [Nonomuraea thailandensis]